MVKCVATHGGSQDIELYTRSVLFFFPSLVKLLYFSARDRQLFNFSSPLAFPCGDTVAAAASKERNAATTLDPVQSKREL